MIPLLILFTLPLLSECKLVIGTGSAMEIIVKGEQFTLAWDPGGPQIPNDPGRVTTYTVYYRNHGSLQWRLLMNVGSSENPACVITHRDLDYGQYDFAVSAANKQGQVSDFHSSLDRTADPFCGWYINWIGSK